MNSYVCKMTKLYQSDVALRGQLRDDSYHFIIHQTFL